MPNTLLPFPDGGYAFIKGGLPYCQGVRAQTGYAIERVRFALPMPVEQGFAAIDAHLASAGRPRTALCAVELRSPKPFSMSGFVGFNEGYVACLEGMGPVSGRTQSGGEVERRSRNRSSRPNLPSMRSATPSPRKPFRRTLSSRAAENGPEAADSRRTSSRAEMLRPPD